MLDCHPHPTEMLAGIDVLVCEDTGSDKLYRNDFFSCIVVV